MGKACSKKNREELIEILGEDNRGVSLLEVVVIVLIIAVVGAASLAGVLKARALDSSACGRTIDSTLDHARLQAMNRAEEDCYLRFILDGGVFYGRLYAKAASSPDPTLLRETKLGTTQVKISLLDASETPLKDISLADGNYFDVRYNKRDGSLASIYGDEVPTPAEYSAGGGSFIIQIVGNTTTRLHIVKETGRSYFE